MNLCKSFTQILSSKSSIKRVLNPNLLLQSSQFSSKSIDFPSESASESESGSDSDLLFSNLELDFPFKKENPPQKYVVRDVPRPKDIPWQSNIANSVNLIGSVSIPIQFQESDDGKFRAGTILSMAKTQSSNPLWIPVVFEGYLAHIAACHLKEKDLIQVDGHLTGGESPELSKLHGHSSIQLMVRNISFVNESSRGKESYTTSKQGVRAPGPSVNMSRDTAWRDLLDNPSQWTDYRKDKLDGLVKPKFPDFKHKDGGQALWIDSAPKWAIPELQITFGKEELSRSNAQTQAGSSSKGNTKKSTEDSWKNLIEDPTNWWDNRAKKLNPKAPDFRHKVTREAVWLSSAPAWVLDKLPPAETL